MPTPTLNEALNIIYQRYVVVYGMQSVFTYLLLCNLDKNVVALSPVIHGPNKLG